MIVYIKNLAKKIIALLLVILVVFVIIVILNKTDFNKEHIVIGAFMHGQEESNSDGDIPEFDSDHYYESDERFLRPSKLPALKLKYDFRRPKDIDEVPPYIPKGFQSKYESSEDVIHAYYAILRNAANMIGYVGGCGTISWMDAPYPYAYELLSKDTKEDISLVEFKDSFKGTGAMTLLHLTPAYQPPDTPNDIKYYFVEIEVLKGHEYKEDKAFKMQSNYFEYYYGIVTTEYDKKDGWKIKSVDYLPEVYLCHPLHGWDYDYKWIIGIIYNNWYNMDLIIDKTEIDNNYIQVFASNEDNEYRFDFIRLTNGDDILLHEYIKEDDRWKEISILKPEHEKYYKISILKFNSQ